MKELIIATRKSALALWQSEFIKAELLKAHPNLSVNLSGFKTKGDVLLDSPLAKIGGKGLFTKELELAMLEKRAHLAVHSLKDVPSELPKGLKLCAYFKRECENDAFLSQKFPNLKALPKGAKVGTTSLRRKMQLLMQRKDLEIISLRGNINSRIEKLNNGEFDAIILAYAGLKRLGLEKNIKYLQIFSIDEMIPASTQGILGIESIDDENILKISSCLNDENTAFLAQIERAFIKKLDGACQVPIGINAKLDGEFVLLKGVLGLPDASEFLKKEARVLKDDARKIGENFAQIFLDLGAKDLLLRAMAME